MKVVFTGDLMLGEQTLLVGMGARSRCRTDYAAVFDGFCAWFREVRADCLVVNLEGVLVEDVQDSPPHERAAKAPLASLAPLRTLGVPVLVSVANNHSMEYGPEAFAKMRDLLDSGGFRVLGLRDHPVEFIETAGTTVGILAFSTVSALYGCEPGYLYADPGKESSLEELLAQVRQARAKCDCLVAYPHWGTEFMTEPSRTQRELASRLAEAGVRMIAGAHPHIVQNAYRVGGAPVYYSLGNLVSDYPLKGMNKSAVVIAEVREGALLTSTHGFDADCNLRISGIDGDLVPLNPPKSDWPDDDAYFKEGMKRRRAVRNQMLRHLLKNLPRVLRNRALITWLVRRAFFLAVNRNRLAKDPNSIYSGPIH